MKALKLLLLASSLLLMAGCQKDKEDIYDSFAGTSWSGINDKVQVELQFTETKKCYLKAASLTLWYNYSVTGLNSSILDPEKTGYSFECTKNDKTLYLKNTKTGATTYVLFKK